MSCMYTVSVGNQIKFDWRISEKWQFHVQFHEKKKYFFILSCFLSKVKVYKLPARYNYDTSTTISMSSKNLLRDPFEQQTVYIGQSQIHPEAGEGLFAKRHSVRFCLFFYLVQIIVFWKIIIKNCVWGNIISKIRDERGSKVK